MKELFNILSGVSNFMNEKRFVYEKGEETEAPAIERKGGLGSADTRTKAEIKNRGAELVRAGKLEEDKGVKKEADTEIKDILTGKQEFDQKGEKYKSSQRKLLSTIEQRYKGYYDKLVEDYNAVETRKLDAEGQKVDKNLKPKKGEDMEIRSERQLDRVPDAEAVMIRIQQQLILGKNVSFYDGSIIKYHVYDKYRLITSKETIVDSVLKKALPKGFDSLVPKDILAMTRGKVKPTMVAEKGKKPATKKGTVVAGAPTRE